MSPGQPWSGGSAAAGRSSPSSPPRWEAAVAILAKHALWLSAGTSVGASGGLFGLLAAALVLVLLERPRSRFALALLVPALVVGPAYSMVLAGPAAGLAVGAAIALGRPPRM